MQEQLQAIVTVLSLVNPLVCGAMFARVEAERSTLERRVDATKVALAIVIILTAAALIGTRLLHLFGVSLDAFMVAGGGVLAWMGFSMLSGQASSSSSNAPSAQGASLTPLILFAASPGTITGVPDCASSHDFKLQRGARIPHATFGGSGGGIIASGGAKYATQTTIGSFV